MFFCTRAFQAYAQISFSLQIIWKITGLTGASILMAISTQCASPVNHSVSRQERYLVLYQESFCKHGQITQSLSVHKLNPRVFSSRLALCGLVEPDQFRLTGIVFHILPKSPRHYCCPQIPQVLGQFSYFLGFPLPLSIYRVFQASV
jgi:hypothetical protein